MHYSYVVCLAMASNEIDSIASKKFNVKRDIFLFPDKTKDEKRRKITHKQQQKNEIRTPLTTLTHNCKARCITARLSLYLSHRSFRNNFMNSLGQLSIESIFYELGCWGISLTGRVSKRVEN